MDVSRDAHHKMESEGNQIRQYNSLIETVFSIFG